MRVVERVVHVPPLLPVADETTRAEETKVVRAGRLGEAGGGGEVADAQLPRLEEREDEAEATGIGKHTERLGERLKGRLVRKPLAHGRHALGLDALDLAAVEWNDPSRCGRRSLHACEDIRYLACSSGSRLRNDCTDVHAMLALVSHGVEGRAGPVRFDADTPRLVAETMQALATPSRVRILGRLRDSACSVGELAAAVGMEQSAVSHQLRILRHLGLVINERHGRRVVYALHDPHVGVLLEEAVYHVQHVRLGAATTAGEASAS